MFVLDRPLLPVWRADKLAVRGPVPGKAIVRGAIADVPCVKTSDFRAKCFETSWGRAIDHRQPH
ncbi:MAG: hypothetical protein OJF48_002239 [Afipia sp.]|nr:MAG: hypothetical protein OJF48_002239 [Afipia sp.]